MPAFKWSTVALKFGHRNLQFLWPLAFVFGHEHIFRGRFMGLLPAVFHYSYSAGMYPVPVMKVGVPVGGSERSLFCIPAIGYKS